MNRIISLDFLKFFAALMITNSHLGDLYGKYSILATGGAIGDSLFFYCSGFALSLSRFDRFDNWYKRRFFRVFPSIVSKNIIALIFGNILLYNSVKQIFNGGGGWFFSSIMIFYVLLYLLQKFCSRFIWLVWGSILGVIFLLSSYFVTTREAVYSSGSYFAWSIYFTIMLFGYLCGKMNQQSYAWNCIKSLCLLCVSILLYYGFLMMCDKMLWPLHVRIISILPLYGIVYSFFKMCQSTQFKSIAKCKLGICMFFIANLCWEIYLAQLYIVLPHSEWINSHIVFPLNIPFAFVLILLVAYLIKLLSLFIVQLMNKNNFDWKSILSVEMKW